MSATRELLIKTSNLISRSREAYDLINNKNFDDGIKTIKVIRQDLDVIENLIPQLKSENHGNQ